MRATFRPLPAWPYPPRPARPATYRVDYSRTLLDLEREIEYLRGREVIIGVVTDESQLRLDGMLKANARVNYPGIEISFEVPGGRRLTFHTDVHREGYTDDWQANLRAIALGLEALRAVDRYGITSTAEQYAGFAMLPPGRPDPERGKRLVEAAGGVTQALKKHHPDYHGDPKDFADVQAYREKVPA